jgi:hypothetical protein
MKLMPRLRLTLLAAVAATSFAMSGDASAQVFKPRGKVKAAAAAPAATKKTKTKARTKPVATTTAKSTPVASGSRPVDLVPDDSADDEPKARVKEPAPKEREPRDRESRDSREPKISDTEVLVVIDD